MKVSLLFNRDKLKEFIQETFSVYEHKTRGIYIMGMWVSIKK